MRPGLPECAQAAPNASRPHQTRALPPKEAAACAVPAGTGCVTPRAGCTTKAILQAILELSSCRVTRGESGRRVSSPEPAPPSPRPPLPWAHAGSRMDGVRTAEPKFSRERIAPGVTLPQISRPRCAGLGALCGQVCWEHLTQGLAWCLTFGYGQPAARLGPRKLGGCRATSSMHGPLQGLPPQWCPRGRTASPRANPGGHHSAP